LKNEAASANNSAYRLVNQLLLNEKTAHAVRRNDAKMEFYCPAHNNYRGDFAF
jgi:hypothetical protein